MSRANYTEDDDDGYLALYRGTVASAMRGRRGQAFFRDLIDALDAMSEKRLITEELVREELPCDMVRWLFAPDAADHDHPWYQVSGIAFPHDCGVCALGALALKRGVDVSRLDPEDADTVGATFNIGDIVFRVPM